MLACPDALHAPLAGPGEGTPQASACVSPFFCSEPPLRSGSEPAPLGPGAAPKRLPGLGPGPLSGNPNTCKPASTSGIIMDLHKELHIGEQHPGMFQHGTCQLTPSHPLQFHVLHAREGTLFAFLLCSGLFKGFGRGWAPDPAVAAVQSP